ncbi:GntR family transcriptional regulator [Dactylosporangium aurantiacum]|uniref:GntR family transcriptional regulator n=1 Tax=Dactylosporangium aurantiacum TaxID=35754 RepID=A0A9Q9INX5_9ACTN|nr:GntR family transcriptional regulator [Dactylosporangium aurantiacum]MDG6108442.1 GntR family transcriptional regulator [Dactylosporangium aurantiacum]UWZ57365.1 GntR family transcriptional regulator [Dactylosporangium aurantiacum]
MQPEHSSTEPSGLSKHELAYRCIRERILDGRYQPGRRLVLSTLARDLDVSPVPVREAIRRLEAEGLVSFERNVGARVATLGDDDWVQLVEMLALLDGYAFAAAAPRMTAERIAVARALNAQLRQEQAHERVMALHRQFHRAIYGWCGNRHVIEALDWIWDRIDASRVLASMYPRLRVRAAVDEHDALLDRLARGDDDAATLESCAREHNLNTIRAIRSAAAQAPAQREPGG